MASWIEDRPVALATSGSTRFRMPTLYCYLRCDQRSPGVTEQRDSPLGLRDDDDDDDKVSQMEGKTNFSRRLYSLSGTGIVECLEIIDVGYNLKQFDGLTRLTLTARFYDRSTPLVMLHNCALYE